MRLFEIEEQEIVSKELRNALNEWLSGSGGPSDINVILSSPFAQRFKTSTAKFVYRAFVFESEAEYKSLFLKIGRLYNHVKGSKVVPFAMNKHGAQAYVEMRALDYDEGASYIIFRKKLQPESIVLNFHAMLQYLTNQGLYNPNMDEEEYEIWLEPTPYYTRFQYDEILFDSRIKHQQYKEKDLPS